MIMVSFFKSLLEEISGINALAVEHLSRCDLEGGYRPPSPF
jgi:hypothetical protein